MKINQIIKEKRKQLGLTQENVAEYLGVSTPAVSKWENGTTYPDKIIENRSEHPYVLQRGNVGDRD